MNVFMTMSPDGGGCELVMAARGRVVPVGRGRGTLASVGCARSGARGAMGGWRDERGGESTGELADGRRELYDAHGVARGVVEAERVR